MLTLSNKIMYSIEAVVDIAYHSNGQPVQSHRISSRQRTPGRYLEQSLQKLVKANILTGVRGPRGGYQLARKRRRISVGEIVRIVTDLETKNLVNFNLIRSNQDLIDRLDRNGDGQYTFADMYYTSRWNGGKGITDRPGGLKLQAEGHDVLYKNVWIKELDLDGKTTDF